MLKVGDTVRILQIPRESFDFSFEKQAISGEVLTIASKVWDYVFDEFVYSVYSDRLKETLWFRKKYLMLIEEDAKVSKFKVGDRVRVVKRVEFEDGWTNSWIEDMDAAVGNTYTIQSIGRSGVTFSDPISKNGFNYRFGFPLSSLELAVKPSAVTVQPKFKIGDRVKVVRRVESQEGWNNSWNKSMDSYLGKQYVIDNIDSSFGISFESESSPVYRFPSDSLELITVKRLATSTNYQYLNGAKLGFDSPAKDLCLTIRTIITKYSDGSAKVNWSVAFKHPKDKFNRELARDAVNSRETKELLLQKGFNRNEIVLKILADMLYHDAYLSDNYKAFVLFLVAQYSTNIIRRALYE